MSEGSWATVKEKDTPTPLLGLYGGGCVLLLKLGCLSDATVPKEQMFPFLHWAGSTRNGITFTFFLEGKLFHRARRPWTEQRQDLVGRTSVQKGLSLILLEHVSLSVAYL